MRLKHSLYLKLLGTFSFCFLFVVFRLQCKYERDGKNNSHIEELRQEILSLQEQAESKRKEWSALAKANGELQRKVVSAYKNGKKVANFKKSLEAFKVYEQISNIRPRNEYDAIPWNAFTFDTIHQIDVGYAREPASHGTPDKRREIQEVIFKAVETLGESFKPSDLVDGFFRTERSLGTQYELFFRMTHEANTFKRVRLVRALADFQAAGPLEVLSTRKRYVNIILPLAGQVEGVESFVRFFLSKLETQDFSRVFLTIVYFGEGGLAQAQKAVKDLFSKRNFTNFLFLPMPEETFSRIRGLQVGITAWNKAEVPILMLADIDLRFDGEFLERCRTQARMGKRVYYPIPFRLYNPHVVFLGKTIPSVQNLFRVHHDYGFWDDWDFTPTCQYRSDFIEAGLVAMNNEDRNFDQVLFRRYLHSDLEVMRAPDKSLFRIYQPRHCQHNMDSPSKIRQQLYDECIELKALHEGPHKLLAALAFGSAKQRQRILQQEASVFV